MGLSNKMLIGIAGGAATLALVGVGAGASFTDSAAVGSSMTTGTLAMQVLATGQQVPSYTDVNDASGQFCYGVVSTNCLSGFKYVTDSLASSPNFGEANDGFTLPSLSELGSAATVTIPFAVLNTGTLNIDSLSVSASDTSGVINQVTTDTNFAIKEASSVAGLATATPLQSEGLGTLEGNNALPLIPTASSIPAALNNGGNKGIEYFEIVLSPENGTYGNADEAMTMTPSFTFTASDQK